MGSWTLSIRLFDYLMFFQTSRWCRQRVITRFWVHLKLWFRKFGIHINLIIDSFNLLEQLKILGKLMVLFSGDQVTFLWLGLFASLKFFDHLGRVHICVQVRVLNLFDLVDCSLSCEKFSWVQRLFLLDRDVSRFSQCVQRVTNGLQHPISILSYLSHRILIFVFCKWSAKSLLGLYLASDLFKLRISCV